MKRLITLILVGFFSEFSAQEKFQCENFDSYTLLNKYNELKHLGINYKFPNGKDVIPVMITI